MGRWTNWLPGDPPPPPVRYPLLSLSGAGQDIDNKGRLVLSKPVQTAQPDRPATEKGENLGIPPFSADAVGAAGGFCPNVQIVQRFRHPDMHTKGQSYAGVCPNVQSPLETVFSWGLYKKPYAEESLGVSGGVSGLDNLDNWTKAPPAEQAAKGLQPNSEFTERQVGPVTLRDGRVMHRFRAGEIPASPQPEVAGLLDKVRRGGVVLVADGAELCVVERFRGQLHPRTLRELRERAGAAIAVLRGEHRERVSCLPAECVAEYDPGTPAA